MCIARVAKVVEVISDEAAVVDADGARAEVSLVVLTLEGVDVAAGTWLLLHTGMAVAVLESAEAEQMAAELRAVTDPNARAAMGSRDG